MSYFKDNEKSIKDGHRLPSSWFEYDSDHDEDKSDCCHHFFMPLSILVIMIILKMMSLYYSKQLVLNLGLKKQIMHSFSWTS